MGQAEAHNPKAGFKKKPGRDKAVAAVVSFAAYHGYFTSAGMHHGLCGAEKAAAGS
jgi:hypothetical protein